MIKIGFAKDILRLIKKEESNEGVGSGTDPALFLLPASLTSKIYLPTEHPPKHLPAQGAGDENLQRFKRRKSVQAIELAVGSRYNVGA